jgi:hypothetical protein
MLLYIHAAMHNDYQTKSVAMNDEVEVMGIKGKTRQYMYDDDVEGESAEESGGWSIFRRLLEDVSGGRVPLLHKQGRECTKQAMQECRQGRRGSLEISTLSSFTSEKKDIRLDFLQGLDPTARKGASLEPDSFQDLECFVDVLNCEMLAFGLAS